MGTLTQHSNDGAPRHPATRLQRWAFHALALLIALTASWLSAAPSPADTSPQDPNDPLTPVTVSADGLPTAQINGVVWSQAMVGNRVYAGGSFSTARPAGSSTGGVTRNNMLAFDVTTGVLSTSFAPSFNAQVRSVAVSPDKSRVYVGGDFTTVDGVTRRRIAAFNASTGALISSFAPPVNYDVHAIVATNQTVYVGGNFSGVGNQNRSNLAAFRASDGALLDWAPTTTGGYVWAMTINPAGTKVVVGGSFTAVNGSSNPGYGLGMIDATTGASLPFETNTHVRNGTVDGAITTLTSDGDNVYGGGYTYGRTGGSWEGTFAASWDDGEVSWLADCHGDTYSLHAQREVVYSASHTHYCENIDAIRQGAGAVGSYPYFRGTAFAKQPSAQKVTWEPDQGRYYSFEGQPAGSMLTWYPALNTGSYTGQFQGPWSVTGNDDYIVMGGEFTRVNGQAQQGLVRFATPAIAPNDRGPSLFSTTYPLNVSSTEAGKVRINWTSNEDIDNEYLTYRVYRDTQNAAGLIHTRSVRARWWNHFGMGRTDTGLAPGSTHQYRVTVTDPFGNVANSPWTTVTVAASGADSAYVKAVQASEPTHYWRFGEGSGTTAADSAGFRPLTTTADVARGVAGPLPDDATDSAARFPGTTTTRAYSSVQDNPPDVFTLEAWFRTTSATGGKIVGRGNRIDRNSSKVDRHLYLTNSGEVVFGVKPNATRQVVSSAAGLNDGEWHHAAATLSPAGMRLYVDGALAGERGDVSVGEHLALGYWRVGGDALTNWPSAPTSAFLAGDIDEVAIYKRALPGAEIQGHFNAAAGTPNQPPTASFTSSTQDLAVSVSSTSTDADGTVAAHAWDFGDGATASTANATHEYDEAGTYPVTLTVTDDKGATATTSRSVTVTAVPIPSALAVDTFERSVTGGWGSAETGGAWVRSGTATNFSVTGGQGRIRMGSAGSGPGVTLPGVSTTAADVTLSLGADKAATGGGTYLTAQPRTMSNGDRYFADVRLLSTGAVSLILGRAVAGAETNLQTQAVSGLTVTPGQLLRMRVQAVGVSPTVLRAKVWAQGSPEPSGWTASVTDSTAALQAAGGIGLRTYLSGSSTNAPVLGLFDDLRVETATP